MNKLIDSPFQDQCDRTCEFKGDVRLPESLNDARIVAQLSSKCSILLHAVEIEITYSLRQYKLIKRAR